MAEVNEQAGGLVALIGYRAEYSSEPGLESKIDALKVHAAFASKCLCFAADIWQLFKMGLLRRG